MEIAGVVIPDRGADLLYGEPRLPQQTRRFVQPLVQQKLQPKDYTINYQVLPKAKRFTNSQKMPNIIIKWLMTLLNR